MIALQASPVNTGTYVLTLNNLWEKEVMLKQNQGLLASQSMTCPTGLSGDCQVFVFSIRTVIQEVENEKICFPYRYYREQKPSVVRGTGIDT